MPMIHCYSRRNQAGVSMIDVMLAIFIFSIGLLGIAGLQVISKKANYEAVQRTTAVMLANDIIERMRANAAQATGTDSAHIPYNAYFRNFEPVIGEVNGNTAEPAPDCSADASTGTTTPCTPAELALHDLWEWQQAVLGATDMVAIDGAISNTGGLVQPSACITDADPTDPNANTVTVAIVWRSQTPTSNPTSTTCGESTGNYGDNNEFRQVFVLTANINPDA